MFWSWMMAFWRLRQFNDIEICAINGMLPPESLLLFAQLFYPENINTTARHFEFCPLTKDSL